jgi:hypothetical protein
VLYGFRSMIGLDPVAFKKDSGTVAGTARGGASHNDAGPLFDSVTRSANEVETQADALF